MQQNEDDERMMNWLALGALIALAFGLAYLQYRTDTTEYRAWAEYWEDHWKRIEEGKE